MKNTGDSILIDGSMFTIIRRLEKPYYKRRNAAVSCNICSEDTEMFPDKTFDVCLSTLKLGYKPCGCSARFRGNSFQNKLRLQRSLEDTNLTVIEEVNTSRKERYYSVHCSVCSKDKELYPELLTSYSLIKKGVLPCGCSPCPSWTEGQNLIRVQRECSKRGLEFLGWIGKYKGNTTKLRLSCEGFVWEDNNLKGFLNGAESWQARNEKIRNAKLRDDAEFLEEIKTHTLYGNMYDITIIRDKGYVFFEYSCVCCSEDAVALSGNCSGRFRFATNKKSKNATPCRCTKNYRWTESQREFLVKETLNTIGGCFIGWTILNNNCYDRFDWECGCGSICNTSFDKFIYDSNRCSSCAKSGFDKKIPAHFYIVRWYGFGEEFIKFGITNRQVMDRIEEQTRNSKLDYEILHTFYHESGQAVWDCEKDIKQEMQTSVCPKEWLPDGYTETVVCNESNLNHILSIIDKYNLKEV